jgi:hypothetical protein
MIVFLPMPRDLTAVREREQTATSNAPASKRAPEDSVKTCDNVVFGPWSIVAFPILSSCGFCSSSSCTQHCALSAGTPQACLVFMTLPSDGVNNISRRTSNMLTIMPVSWRRSTGRWVFHQLILSSARFSSREASMRLRVLVVNAVHDYSYLFP